MTAMVVVTARAIAIAIVTVMVMAMATLTAVTIIEPLDGPDQDEDVIHAAEAEQQEDIDEAVQLAELEVMVADSEQKTASTALLKVSLAFILPKNVHSSHLNSSLNSRSRSTTHLVFVKSLMACALLLTSGHSG